jgi:hypothetical protein
MERREPTALAVVGGLKASSEDVLDSLADTLTNALADFAGPLCGPNADVLAGAHATFANCPCRLRGMQSDKIRRAFAGTRSQIASSLGCAFADIRRSTTHIATRTASCWLGLSCLRGGGILIGLRLGLGIRSRDQPKPKNRNDN